MSFNNPTFGVTGDLGSPPRSRTARAEVPRDGGEGVGFVAAASDSPARRPPRPHEPQKGGEWRCPSCQARRVPVPTADRCFCNAVPSPAPSRISSLHSCASPCARAHPACAHPCPLLCHPGPCPPCRITTDVKCGCPKGAVLALSCGETELSCGAVCGRTLACGAHMCTRPCARAPATPMRATPVSCARPRAAGAVSTRRRSAAARARPCRVPRSPLLPLRPRSRGSAVSCAQTAATASSRVACTAAPSRATPDACSPPVVLMPVLGLTTPSPAPLANVLCPTRLPRLADSTPASTPVASIPVLGSTSPSPVLLGDTRARLTDSTYISTPVVPTRRPWRRCPRWARHPPRPRCSSMSRPTRPPRLADSMCTRGIDACAGLDVPLPRLADSTSVSTPVAPTRCPWR
jgi:hypothetical protein